MVNEERISGAGQVLAQNIRRIREAQRLTYAELTRRLDKAGRHVPVLALQRIETCQRRVDIDDLMALAYALEVCVVDLLVPADALPEEPYPVTSQHQFETESVRQWISGQEIRLAPVPDPNSLFASPGKVMFNAVDFMPVERRKQALRKWLDELDEEEEAQK
jgi:transcriptional regulator with XRE-family HTH domain